MDSDSDEMPPPLEDMTETVQAMQKRKGGPTTQVKLEDEGEEIRLGPKKQPTPNQNITRIMPTEEKKPLIEEIKQEKKPLIQEVTQETKPAKKSSGFGGLKGGFLLGGGAKKTAAKPA